MLDSSSNSNFSDENSVSPKRPKADTYKEHEHSSPILNDNKYIIPPPEDLIAKSVFEHEPIRSGAPISFV